LIDAQGCLWIFGLLNILKEVALVLQPLLFGELIIISINFTQHHLNELNIPFSTSILKCQSMPMI